MNTINHTSDSAAGSALTTSLMQQGGDLAILNYALTLEHFEDVMYRTVIASGLLTGKALDYAKAYGAHESAHVTALTDTITKLGGTPVKEQASYNLPALKTEADVIKLIATVEDVGASAYLGAAPLVQNADLLTVAVQIHTVEAEHATAWRVLAGQNPVSDAFATPRTSDEVLKIVTPFLTPAASAPAAPTTMPNTGDGDNLDAALKIVGVAAGVAIVAGMAISRSQKPEAANEE